MKSRMRKQYKYLAAICRHNKAKSASRLTSNSHLQTLSFEANHRELHTATTTYTFNSPPIFRTSFKLYKGNFPAGTSLRSWDARFSIPFMGFFLLKRAEATAMLACSLLTFNSLYGIFLVKTRYGFSLVFGFPARPILLSRGLFDYLFFAKAFINIIEGFVGGEG